jgi:hypothetical protein
VKGTSKSENDDAEARRAAAVQRAVAEAPTDLSEQQKQTLQELLRGAGSSTQYGKSSSRRDRVPTTAKPVVLPEGDVQPPEPKRRPRKPRRT